MKIAVTSKAFAANEPLVKLLKAHFPQCKFNTTGKLLNKEQLIAFAENCDGMILALEEINEDVLAQLPKLKAIAKYGVGLDNIDKQVCEENGVELLWTGGVNKGSVAEMALGFMLMLQRRLWLGALKLGDGQWLKNGGQSLYGATVGVIGLGHIGKELVKLLKPFNCKIIVNDIEYDEEFVISHGLIKASKEALFSQCDIISLHTPLTKDTRYLINERSLSLCKSNAFILNTARGGLVEEDALKQALLSGQISGAAIDVYEQEPPTDLEFLKIENLITTPHIGGNSAQAVYAMGESAINHLRTYFENRSHDSL
ncbi:MAG: phosphoglycerate dehydrogenase [Psychrobium sp.]